MKVTYEKQEINLKEEIKVSKLLEKEISERKFRYNNNKRLYNKIIRFINKRRNEYL